MICVWDFDWLAATGSASRADRCSSAEPGVVCHLRGSGRSNPNTGWPSRHQSSLVPLTGMCVPPLCGVQAGGALLAVEAANRG